MPFDWADATPVEKRAAVEPYVKDGVSAGETGRILGASRNAVIGVVARSKKSERPLEFKNTTADTPRAKAGIVAKLQRKARESRARMKQRKKAIIVEEAERFDVAPLPPSRAWEALDGSIPVGLMVRTGCTWPIGDNHPPLYCNNPMAGERWCPVHEKMGTRKVS